MAPTVAFISLTVKLFGLTLDPWLVTGYRPTKNVTMQADCGPSERDCLDRLVNERRLQTELGKV